MAKTYKGIAPLTMARTTTGGYVNIYRDDIVPEGVDKDDLKRLLDEGFLGEEEVVESDTSGDAAGSTKEPTVDEILADVGEDKAKAQAALDEENGRDKPRKTLVEKLTALVEA